ncbi:hypothetical protein [Shewanella mangrovi]|uniref:hypothetical protein n=1 Tax=Shewanella mangrovi TaxID=1515746 RepID=UPI000AFCD68F|nr:hypothetical protein [Shewanella mangrovi]
MNANNCQESDSHSIHPQNHTSIQERLKYLLQLSCFWLVLGTYLFPFCKQKISQAFNPQ